MDKNYEKNFAFSSTNQIFTENSATLSIKSCNPKAMLFQEIPVNEKRDNTNRSGWESFL